MKKRKSKQSFGIGSPCHKCGKPTMIRKRLKPPVGKNFYYTQWEFCEHCNAVYFKDEHKSYEWQEVERQNNFFNNL